MKDRNPLRDSLLYSALVVMLSSCAAAPAGVRSINISNPIERLINESLYNFGKRVCGSLGEGIHPMISDVQDKTTFYQVVCEEHGGFDVINLNEYTAGERFDYPQPLKLTLETLLDYVKKKKVILFGEDHDKSRRKDAGIFVSYIPKLKETGFTHLGLEIDRDYQGLIDQYVGNPNTENRQRLFSQLPYYQFTMEDILMIINQAIRTGMPIVCLDNLDPKRDKPRDEHMKIKIDTVLKNGGKVAAFLGGAHTRWSKESEFQYWGDKNIRGSVQSLLIKPLGRYLVEAYGTDTVGLVDLTGCYDSYVFACVE
ncbi:hypothetical protein HYX11_02180 [Candidatus Woesearchaeota archaeon]|nr:hypothetical protein [Candidatus Woesearchaeota archaeon]